jgi:hypothetical protein
MKNSTQPVRGNYFLLLFLLLTIFYVNGQNSFNSGDGWGIGWGNGSGFSPSAGFSLIYTATNTSGSGNRYFRFYGTGSPCGQYGPETASQELQTDTQYNNTTIKCGNDTYAYYLNVSNSTDKYVFKSASSTAAKIVIFKIQGDIRSVTAVEQSPLAANVILCSPTNVTATLDGALSPGQAVYMRYTKDSYTNSTVVQLTGSGTTYTGTIPSVFNTATAGVSYYVFTSGTTAPSGTDADLYTVNLNNNGGSNYSYTVGGATTAIPDPNFEQALIDLSLDCAIDGKVLTSNISGVTALDLKDKNIISLIGIKAFTNLTKLECGNLDSVVGNDNAITDLDVSGMTQLKFLYCENNNISNLNISGLTNLWELITSNNPLSSTTLDVHGSPDLYYLVCQNNGLTSLNITGLTKLQTLIVWNNSLNTLDVSNNPNITYLDCDDNAFASLNVSALTSLNQFYCSGNVLTSMDVRGLTNLANFWCTDNFILNTTTPSLTCILVDDVAAAILKTTTVDTDPLAGGAFLWYKDAGVTYSYCACNLTTTWNGSGWSNGVPTSDTDAIILSNYNASPNISACSLTINNNAVVTIPSGTNVTLNAPIIVTSGSFTLENNANLIQTNKNSINSGAITVNRNSNPLFRLDYTMWSSPVTNQNLLAFSPLTSVSPLSRFYTYNSATNLYNTIANPSATTFTNGTGYLIRMPNTWIDFVPLPGTPATPASWAGVFNGVPNNGTVTLGSPVALTSDKYYAVGNPYPSTISAAAFLSGNNTDGVLYFWRKSNGIANTTSAYATWTTLGTAGSTNAPNNVAPDGTIAVGQGFIVKTGVAETTLNFTNAMRTLFFKTKKSADKSRVWLNLTNTSGAFSQALVGYVDGATNGFDNGIDGKYINDSPIALTSSINNEEYTIQGRPTFDASDVVALNFKTDVAGDYNIAIDHVDGLFSGSQDIYLVDSKTGTETNLKTSAYPFTATVGVDNTRFSLRFQKTLKVDAAVFNDNSVTVYKNKETLYINSGAMAIANIKVFDIQGRLIAERKNVNANSATISTLKTPQQVLIVKVTGLDNAVVSKKIVN